MNNEIKHENKYWLEKDNVFELHFTHFNDDEVILKFMQDIHDSENYIYVSDFLKVEYGEIIAKSVKDVIEQFEDMIIERIVDEISYYEEMLERFQEETHE